MRALSLCRQTLIFLAVGLTTLSTAAIDCVGPPPDDIEWEPEQEEPEVFSNCLTDEDCALIGFGDDAVCAQGQCFSDGEFCDDNADCFPQVCDLDLRTCTPCGEFARCDEFDVCTAGECAPSSQTPRVDFDVEIVPLFEEAACIACHRADAPPIESDLNFDVEATALYDQFLLAGRNRVNTNAPERSTLVSKPMREDPPDHPVGIWNADGPEIERLIQWMSGGAPRTGECRLEELNCYALFLDDQICDVVAQHGISGVTRCIECDERFASLLDRADACGFGFVDAGPVIRSDGGPAPVRDAGSAPVPDAGPAPDAGE